MRSGAQSLVWNLVNRPSRGGLAHARSFRRYGCAGPSPRDPFGTSLARPSVAQELAAQVIGVNSFELPGDPSGVDREIIGQLPSGDCVAIRKSIPRLMSS